IVTLVPLGEPLLAEVSIENQDIGFVAPKQPVRLKLAAYQFQKYGMLDGVVQTVSADAQEQQGGTEAKSAAPSGEPAFKALIELKTQRLDANGLDLSLAAGMQVSAEILQGKRTVLEYLLSPVQRVASEAGMER
ncbi:MAG TPA: HlyD family type I secretion periplasmic adaptor subunit, partial [Gammaproteobacteria bacterium]|nr:HlyD family type I secretion periplasmic adaptor subunit [Gammaproteobacteria bacterium]